MKNASLKFFVAAVAALLASTAPAQRPTDAKPSETVWVPAPTPKGGVSWATLESTKEIQRKEGDVIYSKPDFSAEIRSLSGKRIKVNGYLLPLQNSAKQDHFVLLGYPPDCPYHLNPAPTQFIEVHTKTPVDVENEGMVRTIEGKLVLGGDDESGIFYQIVEGREI